MHSQLGWALLGLVIERSGHGYELAQRFKRVYGDGLSLTYTTNIYRLLDTLRGHELIEEAPARPEEAPAPNRLPKPHYRATEYGTRAYEEWLLAQMEEERRRSRLFARQLAMLEPNAALEVLGEYERECLAEANEAPPPETSREILAHRLVEGEEQTFLEVRLTWIEYARNELKALLAEQTKAARER